MQGGKRWKVIKQKKRKEGRQKGYKKEEKEKGCGKKEGAEQGRTKKKMNALDELFLHAGIDLNEDDVAAKQLMRSLAASDKPIYSTLAAQIEKREKKTASQVKDIDEFLRAAEADEKRWQKKRDEKEGEEAEGEKEKKTSENAVAKKKEKELTEVATLQFGLPSPDDIRLMSVCEVNKANLFDRHMPVPNGLYDTRMGSAMRQFRCTTCDCKYKDCPGHFGHIELPVKLFAPLFFPVLCKILNSICLDCSALLVPKTKQFIERQARCKRPTERLRFVYDSVKSKTTNKQCCGTPSDQRFALPLKDLQTGIEGSRTNVTNVNNSGGDAEVIQALEEGCGNYQPKVVKEGIRLVAKYPELPVSALPETLRKRELKKNKKLPPSKQKKKKKNGGAGVEKDGEADKNTEAEGDESAEEKRTAVAEYDLIRRQRAGTSRSLSADEVFSILNRLSDEDCWLLGFDPRYGRPAWMILSVLPVPPPVIRPPIISTFGKKPISHDQLTLALIEIVKASNKLKRQIDHNISTFQENYRMLLQYHVATYIDNETKGVPKAKLTHSSEMLRSCIVERFKGKMGRIRGNLMGKRVDFSARTVITPDPNIGLNEIGVPMEVATRLTYPERVCSLNIERLQRSVLLGPRALSGAKTVTDNNQRMIDLKYLPDVQLEYGYVVERHLRDGDVVAVNRQPSLHKFSMMAHRVRIMNCSTFRLNLSVTGPYNADFDGDEMNLHVPQSIGAVAELLVLMDAGKSMVTPHNGKLLIGLCQDSLLAARLLTQRNVFLERSDVMQLLMFASGSAFSASATSSRSASAFSASGSALPMPAILKPRPLWTGKQVVSMMLPTDLCLGPSANRFKPKNESGENPMTPSDCVVLIRDGLLLSGILDKKFVGATNGSIVHVLNNDYGSDVARVFVEEMQGVTQEYVTEFRGMSVGIEDCCLAPATRLAVDDVIRETKQNVKLLAKDYRRGEMSTAAYETKVTLLLNRARDNAGRKVSDMLDPNFNNFKLMSTAGSKGADVNIAQISALVGQQNLNGGRIPEMFKNRGMPHSAKFDAENVAARGFVQSSFMDGLSPMEMFMHAVGGREGLCDTAVKTGYIGYIQRRLIKAGEDISVWQDMTVRSAIKDIVQFSYGDDSFDGTAFEWQKFDLLERSNAEIFAMCGPTGLEETMEEVLLLENEVNILLRYRDELRLSVYPRTDTSWPLPGNLKRLLASITRRGQKQADKKEAVAELGIEECVELLEDNVGFEDDNLFYAAFLRYQLSPRFCREKFFLTQNDLAELFVTLKKKHMGWLVAPGENVGLLAAQAVGEPATQMTLNSVDYATPMAISFLGRPVDGPIGALIDALLEQRSEKIQIQPDGVTTYLPLERGEAIALSCDSEGNARWTAVEAVTRHPVVNKDGSSTLLRVELESGKTVDVTKAKSVLIYQKDSGTFEAKDNFQVGDCVPVFAPLVSGCRHKSYSFYPTEGSRKRVKDHVLERIVSITPTTATGPTGMVYDLTVAETRNMTTRSGIGLADTFHFAGIDNENVTSGMPRLEELIKATNSIKIPLLTLYLDYDAKGMFEAAAKKKRAVRNEEDADEAEPEGETKEEKKERLALRARLIAGKMPHVVVNDVVVRQSVMYKPFSLEDNRMIPPAALRSRIDQFGPLLDWVLVLHLSRSKMFERGITPANVASVLLRHYKGAVDVVASNDNDIFNNEENDYGGYVEARMHLYDVLDSLRASLPEYHHETIETLEQQQKDAEKDEEESDLLASSSATALRIKRKISKKRKRSVIVESAAEENAENADREADNADREADNADSVEREKAKREAAAAKKRATAWAKAVEEENQMRSEAEEEKHVWGNLDITTCFPMIVEHLGDDCRKITLDGVETITSVSVREMPRTYYNGNTGALEKDAKEWVLQALGNNMSGSFALQGIDHRRTRSNSPVHVARVLGIEAARKCLFEELRAVLQFDGTYVNYRHISLLCDIMTHCGTLMAINRHGLNRRLTGPLMRATLEEPTAMLTNAACFSEFDSLSGPSERVMMGKFIQVPNIQLILDPLVFESASVPPVAPFLPQKKLEPLNSRQIQECGMPTVDASPFAPLQDKNAERMVEDIKSLLVVRKQRKEEEERRRQELAELEREEVEKEIEMANPFLTLGKEEVEEKKIEMANPFLVAMETQEVEGDKKADKNEKDADGNGGNENNKPPKRRRVSFPQRDVCFINPFASSTSATASASAVFPSTPALLFTASAPTTSAFFYVPSSPRRWPKKESWAKK